MPTETPSRPRWLRGLRRMTPGCPAPSELLLYALQLPDGRESQGVAEHVSRCATCHASVTGIRETASVLHSSGRDTWESENCLDEMVVANVVDQSMDMAEHPELIAHLASCPRCLDQVASVARLLGETAVAAEVQRFEQAPASPVAHRWRNAGGGALAALAATVVFMVVGTGDRRPATTTPTEVASAETHRQQSVTMTTAPQLIAPVGAVAAVDTFRWTSVPRADRYRVTLFHREGTVVWEAEGRDTAMVLPKSVALDRTITYLWKVEARTERDRWVASALIEFLIPRIGRLPK